MVVSGKLKVEKGGDERVATTLFADIRGFTSMCETMEASEVLCFLNEFFEMMVEIAFSYEGTVDKFVGDMIMVIWGAPVTHDDDPRRAVQAALDMQAALDRYNACCKHPFRIGIGINTDKLVAGYIGSTRTMSYSVIGDAVNTAARLCSAAGPGQVLISENTYRQIRQHFDVVELDPIKLKGKSKPLKVYSVLGVKRGPAL
jgi:adenylate cyclase